MRRRREIAAADGRARILVGHVLDRLRGLPDESVHCVVTSPPYWGLRNYGTEPQVWGGDAGCQHEWDTRRYYVEGGGGARSSGEAFSEPGGANAARIKKARWREDATCRKCGAWLGQLGLEPTPELYAEHMVEVFGEVRRVLRNDGTLWLVLGDSYSNVGGNNWGSAPAVPDGARPPYRRGDRGATPNACGGRSARKIGLKPKDMLGMPWRVAFGLQADGWFLRSDVVWAKSVSFCPTYSGSCMPESVRDRPTKAHEYVFLLTKSRRYYFDMEAVKEPCAESSKKRIGQRTFHKQRGGKKDYGGGINSNRSARKALENFARSGGEKRHIRSVWTISPRAFPGAHFAVFPERLVEPCVKAGTSEKGCCPGCGAPCGRIAKEPRGKRDRTCGRNSSSAARGNGRRKLDSQPENAAGRRLCANVRKARAATGEHDNPFPVAETADWRPTCDCESGDPVPCTVLDPFLGSGTTALAALKLCRAAIGIELNPGYAEMARKRIEEAGLLRRRAAR